MHGQTLFCPGTDGPTINGKEEREEKAQQLAAELEQAKERIRTLEGAVEFQRRHIAIIQGRSFTDAI